MLTTLPNTKPAMAVAAGLAGTDAVPGMADVEGADTCPLAPVGIAIVAAAHTSSRPPETLWTRHRGGSSFSASTSSVSAAIHSRFITPKTSSRAISSQQQPKPRAPSQTRHRRPNTQRMSRLTRRRRLFMLKAQ